MKKLLAAIVAIPAVVLGALYLVVLYEGPRMTVQPHVRTFQAILPAVPQGTVTVEKPVALPTAAQAATLMSPLPRTPATLAQGKVYYTYYCVFCHGERGDGTGPVGQSYTPVPADLRGGKVRGYSDGQLLRSMLTGVGHEPVLERVVKPRHRWALVMYVKGFSAGK